jgi:14-3-3 protein epsilon
MSFIEAFDLANDRNKIFKLAQIAEGAERYDDMRLVMTKLVQVLTAAQDPLSVDERNLLSVAFKNVVGARRASLRSINVSEEDSNCRSPLIEAYKKQMQAELKEICETILDLLTDGLIVDGLHDEAQVFYLKMGADYYRYLAECVTGDTENPQKAVEFYDKAMVIAEKTLEATHPIRLGLALNYSVCLYEIVKKQPEACNLAKKAFDEAISKLDKLEEADYKDSTLIMQLLRDNLTLWTASDDGNPGDDEN